MHSILFVSLIKVIPTQNYILFVYLVVICLPNQIVSPTRSGAMSVLIHQYIPSAFYGCLVTQQWRTSLVLNPSHLLNFSGWLQLSALKGPMCLE